MRRISLLLVTLLYACCLWAAGGVAIHLEPGWILPGVLNPSRVQDPKNISNGYYLELQDRQVNLTNNTEYLHFIRRITNESGVQDASEVSVLFAPQYQQVVFHRVDVIRDGKYVSQLSKSSIKTSDEETGAENFEYNGKKRAYIILKDIQKGDRIEVSYSVIGMNPVFQGRYSDYFYFYRESPVLNFYLRILAKPGQTLHIKTFNEAPEPELSKVGVNPLYQWKNPGIETDLQSKGTPSWFTALPYVFISDFSNWREVNDWALEIFHQYQYRLPDKLLNKMAEWRKASAGDPDMFANLALRFVQDQVRYLALEMGSNSHQPHSPEEVFNQRYGDCKDKALLLVAILQHEQIDAYIALTNTDEREKTSLAAATPLAFNHAIVALKRSREFSFLDPTISLQRGELINNFIPGYGQALVIRPGTTSLTPIEAGTNSSTSITEDLQVSFDDSSLFRVTSMYKGGEADDQRSFLAGLSSAELKANYLKYYQKIYDGILADSAIAISDDSLKNELQINEFYKIPKLWRKNDSSVIEFDAEAPLISAKFQDPRQFKKGEPIALDYPSQLEYIFRVQFPEEWSMDIKEVHIKNDAYQFDYTPVDNRHRQVYKYYFKTFRDYIASEDVDQYKKDYNEIEKCLTLSFTKRTGISDNKVKLPVQPERTLNWQNIWLSFFFCVVMTILFQYLNKKSAHVETVYYGDGSFGGWTIFLGITLLIRVVLQLFYLFKNGYYRHDVWIQLAKSGGLGLQGIIEMEILFSLFSVAGALALLYWFIKKRDIFPRMFIYYCCIYLTTYFILLMSYYYVHVTIDMKDVQTTAMIDFVRGIFYSAIWIAYVRRSENVKEVFVQPFV